VSIEEDIAAQYLGSAEADHHLNEFTHKLADEVRDLTPTFGDLPPKRNEPEYGQPGDAKAAIKVENAPKKLHAKRVISRDFKAIWIELGSTHMPEYAPFAKVAAMHGGTGPEFEEGIQHAQGKLRQELEKFEKLAAEGVDGALLAEQRRAVDRARQGRSSAFKAARRGRRR